MKPWHWWTAGSIIIVLILGGASYFIIASANSKYAAEQASSDPFKSQTAKATPAVNVPKIEVVKQQQQPAPTAAELELAKLREEKRILESKLAAKSAPPARASKAGAD